MKFIIAGPRDNDGTQLYWSNSDGWVDRDSATVFTNPSVTNPIGTTNRIQIK